MRRKLGLGIAAAAVILVGAGFGTHFVIKGKIEDVITKLEERSPGTKIEYGGYYLDPRGFELVLRDVAIKQTLPSLAAGGADPASPKMPTSISVKAEKVIYRDCDFANPVPRHCQGSMWGVTFGTETEEWRELTAKLEEMTGKPAIFDVVSESSYDPAKEHRFSTQAKITLRDFGSFDLAMSGDGVNMDALVEKLRTAMPALETGGEEARTAFAIGLMGDVSNLRIAGLSMEVAGKAALDKLLGALFGMFDVEGTGQVSDPAQRLAKFDEIVQKLKDGPTTQPAATFLSDPAVRTFLEKPESLGFKIAPDAPVTVMSFGMKVMGGMQALSELKLKMLANGKELPLEPLIAASSAMMMSGGDDPGALPSPEDMEPFDPEAVMPEEADDASTGAEGTPDSDL